MCLKKSIHFETKIYVVLVKTANYELIIGDIKSGIRPAAYLCQCFNYFDGIFSISAFTLSDVLRSLGPSAKFLAS